MATLRAFSGMKPQWTSSKDGLDLRLPRRWASGSDYSHCPGHVNQRISVGLLPQTSRAQVDKPQGIAMNEMTPNQDNEEFFTYEVSDEALEVAAAFLEKGKANPITQVMCTAVFCPGP